MYIQQKEVINWDISKHAVKCLMGKQMTHINSINTI
jgi:hypothetical protein